MFQFGMRITIDACVLMFNPFIHGAYFNLLPHATSLRKTAFAHASNPNVNPKKSSRISG